MTSRPGQPSPESERAGARAARHDDLVTAVFDAVHDQLVEVGYQRLTMEKVAVQAGVSKATLYRRWSSKPQLVIEAMRERWNPQPVKSAHDLRSDLRALVGYAVQVIAFTPLGQGFPQLVADCRADEAASADLVNWLGPHRATHRAMLYAAAARHELPFDADPHVLLDVIAGTVLWRTLLGQPPDDNLVDQLVELIVDRRLPRNNGFSG